jgi:hypothetical protein
MGTGFWLESHGVDVGRHEEIVEVLGLLLRTGLMGRDF